MEDVGCHWTRPTLVALAASVNSEGKPTMYCVEGGELGMAYAPS